MTLTVRAPRALLRFDDITVQREAGTADAEGNVTASRTLVFSGKGTVSIASSSEQLLAAQRGSRVDQILSLELGLDVQAGDFVTVGAVTYEVVQVDQRRLFQRAIMRIET